MKLQLRKLVSGATGLWCQLPYPNHPNGCPNFGKKDGCPPLAHRWNELIEFPYYLVYRKFDLEAQEKRMLEKHPEWSKRQARCCLYWQKRLLKDLLDEAWGFLHDLEYHKKEDYIVLENPEGAGIDLFKTCSLAGIELERDYLNQKYVYKIVIVAKRTREK